MTLTQYEELCQKVFSERLPVIRDASDAEAERLTEAVMSELEQVALSSGLEVCQSGAALLVLARYDMALHDNADMLGVGPEYFTGDRAAEQEAFMYLHQRRCGAPARHENAA
jgi:hypothetical protein